MSSYNPQDNQGTDAVEENSRNQSDSPAEAIYSESKEYKIFPSTNSDGGHCLKIYRLGGEKIPWEDQEWLEDFVHRSDTWVASLVPNDSSRYLIGLLDCAIESGSYTDIVEKIVEKL